MKLREVPLTAWLCGRTAESRHRNTFVISPAPHQLLTSYGGTVSLCTHVFFRLNWIVLNIESSKVQIFKEEETLLHSYTHTFLHFFTMVTKWLHISSLTTYLLINNVETRDPIGSKKFQQDKWTTSAPFFRSFMIPHLHIVDIESCVSCHKIWTCSALTFMAFSEIFCKCATCIIKQKIQLVSSCIEYT